MLNQLLTERDLLLLYSLAVDVILENSCYTEAKTPLAARRERRYHGSRGTGRNVISVIDGGSNEVYFGRE